MAAEPAAGRPLRRWPRVPRWRRGAPDDSDRRARHELGRRRRRRSGLETCRNAQGLGRTGSAQVLRNGTPPGRTEQCRGLALCLVGPAQVALANQGRCRLPRAFSRGRTRPPCRDRRRRATQVERDDRRRARLFLRLTADRIGARRPAALRFHRIQAVDIARCAAAARLARRRRRHAGQDRRRLHVAAARWQPSTTQPACKRPSPQSARRSRCSMCRTKRRATSMHATSSCCAPTCTSSGAATVHRTTQNVSPR